MLNKHAQKPRLLSTPVTSVAVPALLAAVLATSTFAAAGTAAADDTAPATPSVTQQSGGAVPGATTPSQSASPTLPGGDEGATGSATGKAPRTAADAAPSDEAKSVDIVGLPVVTRDGERVGDVVMVVADPDGAMQAVLVKTGGFLGFGSKRIAIPVDKIAQQDKSVRLTLTAEEVSALPEVPAQSG